MLSGCIALLSGLFWLNHRITESLLQLRIGVISGVLLIASLSLAKQSIMVINANNEYVHVKCPNTVISLLFARTARYCYLSE